MLLSKRKKVIDALEQSGIYIYYWSENNSNNQIPHDQVLYVGKAQKLYKRIEDHYKESIYDCSSKDNLNKVYKAFFNKYLKKCNNNKPYTLKIKCIYVKDECNRVILESALHKELKPLFIDFQKHKRINGRKKNCNQIFQIISGNFKINSTAKKYCS